MDLGSIAEKREIKYVFVLIQQKYLDIIEKELSASLGIHKCMPKDDSQ